MATLAVTELSPAAGITDVVASAAGGGDVFPNTGKEWVEVINGGAGSINVTVTPVNKINGLTISPLVIAVGAGVRKKLGPFDPGIFNNGSGQVALAYSGVTTVTVGVYKAP